MDIAGTGKRVRIYIGEQDRAPGHHQPLWETLMDLLRTEGAAGATMLRGLAGFGSHGTLHVARIADLVPDLPVVIEWIDGPERVERLLQRVCDLVRTGTVTIEDVAIVKYSHREPRPLPPDRVDAVMTRAVVSIDTQTPLARVIELLLDRDFRALPVVDADDRLAGIITNQDLVQWGGLSARVELLAALAPPLLERELTQMELGQRTAADVMTTPVIRAQADTTLKAAAHLMADKHIKRLPIVDSQERLIGMLSRADVLRTVGQDYRAESSVEGARPTSSSAQVVGDLMRSEVPTVTEAAPLGEVLDAVTSTRLNRALVVDSDRRVVGVVTDAEVLKRLDAAQQASALPALMRRGRFGGEAHVTAREVMRTPATTATTDTPIC